MKTIYLIGAVATRCLCVWTPKSFDKSSCVAIALGLSAHWKIETMKEKK